MQSAAIHSRPRSIAALLTVTAAIAGLVPGAGATGPDVIVGDIPNTTHHTSAGAVGGKRAYSIGTTSCNLGDQGLSWISGTNQHPVISQNMYRLANGRYEQIGQAWLKHGFCALQGNVCATCSDPNHGCNALMPGCSDPYSSGLNGDQGGLGPKSEVNATTGAFPYPFSGQGTTGDAIFKRLQVNQTDLTTAGALYFVASMYVQPEDATANNNDNNESYRRVTVNQTTFDLSLQDSTHRQSPGIQAWHDQDATVTSTAVDVTGDGRFWIAVKTTNLGGGVFHYEYAVQNLNSHRSGQAFSIPIPNGTTVTNVGFHDVDYHSGEPYALTDWTPTVSATSVSWATQTFAQNANANALRWDTLYNFRFDANVAPGSGAATLTLFRTGSPASVTAATIIPGGGVLPPPSNDTCAAASALSNGTTAFDTTGATTDAPTQTGCGSSVSIFNDIWYVYSTPCAGNVTITTCGSSFDTKLAVYTACPSANNTAIICNDDSSTCGTNSLQSAVTFAATANTSYFVRVGAFTNGTTGGGSLNVSGPSCGVLGDSCNAPINLAAYGATSFTTVGATTDGPAPTTCGTGNQIANDIWFTYTACATGNHTVNTCTGGSFDSVLAVYTGACGALNQVACNDDTAGCGAGGLSSSVTWAATSGTQYRIRLGGFNGATGTGTLTLSGPACGGPANDLCANAINLTSYGTTAFSNAGAGNDGPAPTTCGTGNQIGADIWYTYTTCVAGNHTVDTCTNGNYDSVIVVYTGACGALNSVACNDDACGAGGLSSSLTWAATANTQYRIRVGGYQGATGSGTLTLSGPACPPPGPANDLCTNRAGVGLGQTPFTTVGATTDGPAHSLCLNAGSNQITNDIWYNYPSSCNGQLTVDTCNSTNYDSKIAIYAYNGTCADISDTTLRACNDDACGAGGLASSLTINVVSGQNYAIRVGGFNGATGTGILTLTCVPAGVRGDMNCDGVTNNFDIQPFVLALTNPAAYQAAFPNCNILNGDINHDGVLNNFDIDGFVACLTTGCP